MIAGKTTMGKKTMEQMKAQGCVHVSPRGVSPNLWVDAIRVTGVELLAELGAIEATWQLALDNLGPFVVDIDTQGENLFEQMDEAVAENQAAAYEFLGIPEGFEYTKLY